MKKNILWIILLILGLIPFVIVLGYGIYSAITGFSGICFYNCTHEYGLIAFTDSIILYSYVYWPTYVIGLILILISIILLKICKKKKD